MHAAVDSPTDHVRYVRDCVVTFSCGHTGLVREGAVFGKCGQCNVGVPQKVEAVENASRLERVRAVLESVKAGWEARPERHLTPREKTERNAQRELVELIESELDAGR